jgi:hypothetical protein
MVRQQVVDRAVLPHGNPLAARVVVLADGAPRLLVVVTDVNGSGCVDCGLHPLAIAVVDEGGTRPAAHPGQPVLSVIREREALPARRAAHHVAVGVVGVAVAAAHPCHGVPVRRIPVHVAAPTRTSVGGGVGCRVPPAIPIVRVGNRFAGGRVDTSIQLLTCNPRENYLSPVRTQPHGTHSFG